MLNCYFTLWLNRQKFMSFSQKSTFKKLNIEFGTCWPNLDFFVKPCKNNVSLLCEQRILASLF